MSESNNLFLKDEMRVYIFYPVVVGIILALILFFFAYKQRTILLNFIKRFRYKFFPVSINIALSLDSSEGLNTGVYFKEIKKNIEANIIKSGLGKEIKIIDVSNIIKFNSKEEVEKFDISKDIDLIIWGTFSDDRLKCAGQGVSNLDLKFTYLHPNDKENKIGSMILLDIQSKLAIKNYWSIVDKDSSLHVRIISNNIFDISTYILALILKMHGKIEKSLNLFEILYFELLKRNDIFYKTVEPHLISCYDLLILNKYSKNKKQSWIDCELYCNKILHLQPGQLGATSNLAFFQYKLQKNEESENNVEFLIKKYPNSPLTQTNIAFIRIMQKRYKDAYYHYMKLSKMDINEFNPQQVIEFLDTEFKTTKEPGLLYGAGIISYFFVDKSVAKSFFIDFINIFNKEESKIMYNRACELISRINK